METRTLWIAFAVAVLVPAALAAQQPGGNLPGGTTPALPLPAPAAADEATQDSAEMHEVFRRPAGERGQRPRRGPRHWLRRLVGARRPGPGMQVHPQGAGAAGHPLLPGPAPAVAGPFDSPKPPPDPPG